MGDLSGYGGDDEKPLHQVKLDDFRISACEITNRQYGDFLNSPGSSNEKVSEWLDLSDPYCRISKNEKYGIFFVEEGMEKHPVVTVSWFGAAAFANYLNEKKELRPCYNEKDGSCDFSAKGFRLPTEAEWEYACRAGTKTPFNTGENVTTDQANYDGNYPYKNNQKGIFVGKTTPVGAYPPNVWGVSDMHGNVWEWCMDWYGGKYYDECKEKGVVENPQGPETGSFRVLRSGSWINLGQACRSANRSFNYPGNRRDGIGFHLMFVP